MASCDSALRAAMASLRVQKGDPRLLVTRCFSRAGLRLRSGGRAEETCPFGTACVRDSLVASCDSALRAATLRFACKKAILAFLSNPRNPRTAQLLDHPRASAEIKNPAAGGCRIFYVGGLVSSPANPMRYQRFCADLARSF